MKKEVYNKFDIVYYEDTMVLILVGPMEIPYYMDSPSSQASCHPLDFTNPNEWEHSFTGYIAHDMISNKHIIVQHDRVKDTFDYHIYESSWLGDHATGRLRNLLGLLLLQGKVDGRNYWLKFLAKELNKQCF